MGSPRMIREDQMPSDPLMRGPWAGSLRWAIGNEEVVARFREETGAKWTPGRTGLDHVIDAATGADFAFISAFVDWHNERIWGDLSMPAFSDADIDRLSGEDEGGEHGEG